MIVDCVLANAKAYLNGQIVDCSIAIEEGKIQKIGKESQMPYADQKINLRNLLVLPGLIDDHVHLRDEGKAYKEDFTSGTAAAASGGFTTVLDMPNNEPVTMSVETLINRVKIAQKKVLVNVGFYSEFPQNISEVKGIVTGGPIGFKLFMGCQIGGIDIDDDEALKNAFKEVASFQLPVAVHAEDKALLTANEQKLKQAKKIAINDYLRAHTEAVEVKAIDRLLKLSAQTNMHLHFCHVSTQEGIKAIVEAKKSGRTITCEATLNHLLLTSDDLKRYGQMVVMAPPLRNKNSIEALWQGLQGGGVDVIGSDHAPHAPSEKVADSVWDVKVGVPGLETSLPLLMSYVHNGKLSLVQVVKLLAEKPAEIYGLSDLGHLEQGKSADLTIIDFNSTFRIDASKFKSKAKYSPYDGWEVQGKPVKTIVNGQVVFDEGEVIAKPGSGSIVRRHMS